MPWTDGDFYGECLPADWAQDVTGDAIGSGNGRGLTYLYDDTDTETAEAGDSFLVGLYPDVAYLTPTTPVVFTAVFEMAGGSMGTFRVRAGLDPDWELLNPDLATQTLGTFTASGEGRIISPEITVFTAPMIYDGDIQPILFIEVLTGVVVFKQMRVRMWPPGGPSGNWSPVEPWTSTARPNVLVSGPSWIRITDEAEHGQTTYPDPDWGWGPEEFFEGPGIHGGYDTYGGASNADPSFVEMVNALSEHRELVPTYQTFTETYSDTYPENDGAHVGAEYLFGWGLMQLAEPTHEWRGWLRGAMALVLDPPDIESHHPTLLSFTDPDRIPWERSGSLRASGTQGSLHAAFGGWVDGAGLWMGSPEATSPADPGAAAFIGVATYPLTSRPDFSVEQNIGFVRRNYRVEGPGYDAFRVPGTTFSATEGQAIAVPDVPFFALEVVPNLAFFPPASYTVFDFDSTIGSGSGTGADRSVVVKPVAIHNWFGAEVFDPALPYVSTDPISVTAMPASGYYVNPNPNLGGEGDDVRVSFAAVR